jgi:hypothetical protein
MTDIKDNGVGGTGLNPQTVIMMESTECPEHAAHLVISDQCIKELMETVLSMFATDGSDRPSGCK